MWYAGGMATVTSAGVVGRTMPQYITDLQGVFRDAFGPDLDLAGESPQGQIIAAVARMLADTDAAVVAVGNRSFSTAVGYELDDYGALLDFRRQPGTQSYVEAVVGGEVGATVGIRNTASDANGNGFELALISQLPSGYANTNYEQPATMVTMVTPPNFVSYTPYRLNSVVKAGDGANYINAGPNTITAQYLRTADGWTPFPHPGYAYVRFIAVNNGANQVPVDGLTFDARTLGLAKIYNKQSIIAGTPPESDESYRRRFANGLARNSAGTAAGIIAALTEGLPAAYLERAYLLENPNTERDLTVRIPGGIRDPGDPLVGGLVTATVADIVAAEAAVTSGRVLEFTIDPLDLTAPVRAHFGPYPWSILAANMDFSGITTFEGIATVLQRAYRVAGGFMGRYSTVTYDGGRFIITASGLDASSDPISFRPTIGINSPLANALGLSAAGGAIADYMPPCAIAPILDWGSASPQIIAAQAPTITRIVEQSKPAGVRTYGAAGASPAFYTNATPIQLSVAAIISVTSDFPADGIQRIQSGLAEYITGLGLSVQYNQQAMWAILYRVPGWSWGNNAAADTPGTDFVVTGGVTTLNRISRYFLSEDRVTVTVI